MMWNVFYIDIFQRSRVWEEVEDVIADHNDKGDDNLTRLVMTSKTWRKHLWCLNKTELKEEGRNKSQIENKVSQQEAQTGNPNFMKPICEMLNEWN